MVQNKEFSVRTECRAETTECRAGKESRKECGKEYGKESRKECGKESGKEYGKESRKECGKESRKECGKEYGKESRKECGKEYGGNEKYFQCKTTFAESKGETVLEDQAH